MRISHALCGVTALGPGSRFAMWVNGCPRECRGCVSPRLRIADPATETDVKEFLSRYDWKSADGVTISGGEPFSQPEGLAEAVRIFVEGGIEDVLVYTGYKIGELRAMKDECVDYVLGNIAVLIDGPYIEELNADVGNIKGSVNQRIIYLKPQYRQVYREYIKPQRSMQEFDLGDMKFAVGIPDRRYITQFLGRKENG